MITLSASSVVTGILLLMCASCGILSTILFYVMRAEVNAKLETTEHIAAIGATPMTYQRVRRLHKDMYPTSRLTTACDGIVIVGLSLIAAIAWRIGAL